MTFKEKIKEALLNKRIFKTDHKELGISIHSYSRLTQYDSDWDDITVMCRGLILDNDYKIVGRGFNKFWNLLESPTPPLKDLEGLKFTCTEKMDGSLIILFFYLGEWRVATKGSFYSTQAEWASKWVDTNIKEKTEKYLNPEFSYLFEAIYSDNQIVVKYGDREELVLLGAVNNETGVELPSKDLKLIADDIGATLTPTIEASSLNELQEIAKTLDSNKEGFVVTFENGMKVKIKGDEYCRIHKLISYMTPLAFWDSWDYNTDPKNPGIPKTYLAQLPEEFREECDALLEVIEGLHWDIWDTAKKYYDEASKHIDVLDPKALAQYSLSTFGKKYANFVMKYAKCVQTNSKHSYWKFWFSAHQLVRPSYNKLPEGEKFDRLNRIKSEK